MSEISLKNLRFLNILFVILIIFAALILARNIVGTSFSKKGVKITGDLNKLSSKTVFKKINLSQYSSILEKNPFGPSSKLVPVFVSADRPESQAIYKSISGLVLVGTAVGPGDLSYAVFEDKAASPLFVQDVFRYGEKVFQYGSLVKIAHSYVEIEQGGSVVKVEMPVKTIDSVTEIAVPEAKSKDLSQGSFAKKIGEKKYILDREKVQQSLENPEKLLTDARLLPNFKNGKQEGFTISEVVPEGLYHSMGLRNGDTLLRINGLRISNPEVAIQAMSALKGMNRVNLDIIRKNENMSMSYQIR